MIFYLTNNDARKEPIVLLDEDYIHVKAKCDGSQTVIICHEKIDAPSMTEMSKQEAQSLLDTWIDEENVLPYQIDINGNEIIQSYIDLEGFLNG